jgi:hypothetical protein
LSKGYFLSYEKKKKGKKGAGDLRGATGETSKLPSCKWEIEYLTLVKMG